jgi:hypothetical protein
MDRYFWSAVDHVDFVSHRLSRFLNRHRNKLVILGLLSGTAYAATKILKSSEISKISEQIQNEEKALSKLR